MTGTGSYAWAQKHELPLDSAELAFAAVNVQPTNLSNWSSWYSTALQNQPVTVDAPFTVKGNRGSS